MRIGNDMNETVACFRFFSAAEKDMTKGVKALQNCHNINAKLFLQKAISNFNQMTIKTDNTLSRLAFTYYLLAKANENTKHFKKAYNFYQLAISNMLLMRQITKDNEKMIEAYRWHLNDVLVQLNKIAFEKTVHKAKIK